MKRLGIRRGWAVGLLIVNSWALAASLEESAVEIGTQKHKPACKTANYNGTTPNSQPNNKNSILGWYGHGMSSYKHLNQRLLDKDMKTYINIKCGKHMIIPHLRLTASQEGPGICSHSTPSCFFEQSCCLPRQTPCDRWDGTTRNCLWIIQDKDKRCKERQM